MDYNNFREKGEKERIQILKDDKDNFIIKIFMRLDKSRFDLSILGLLFLFSILSIITLLYLLYLLKHNPSNLFQLFYLLFTCIGISFFIILLFFDNGMVYYMINIDKINKTIELRKDFIYFTLKKKRIPIDEIKEINNEIISNSDGFTFTKYYSSKLLPKK
jgi:hypothetical protein